MTKRELTPLVTEVASRQYGLRRITIPTVRTPNITLVGDEGYFICGRCWGTLFADQKKLFEECRKYYETTGRSEDVARLCEEFGFPEEAGRIREQRQHITVKHVTVNINELLERLRSGGLVSVYKCPNCGGGIKISGTSSMDRLSKCEYCGTVLKTDDLVQFLQDILR
jgi:DNA-directed RNA polymerase subunit RPC12/RpoP